MELFFLVLLVIFSSPSLCAEATDFEWFSDHPRQIPPLLADPMEAQLRTGYLWSGKKKMYFEFGVGGQFEIARKTWDEGTLAFQGRAQAHSRFELFSHSFDLHNSDFIGGLSTTYRRESTVLEVLVGHQSSHLGDDIQSRGLGFPINFSFEFLRFLASLTIRETLRLYGGAQTNFRSDPASIRWKPTVILGGDWRPFSGAPDFFTALDFRFMGINQYSPNLSAAIGYELGDRERVKKRQRVQLQVFNGYSNLGQYYQHREFYVQLLIAYPF